MALDIHEKGFSISKPIVFYSIVERVDRIARERERARRKGTFVTKMGNFGVGNRELV